MWGRHVESTIREAIKKAKTDKEAEQKALSALVKLLTDPREENSESPTGGRFRDPAALMNRK